MTPVRGLILAMTLWLALALLVPAPWLCPGLFDDEDRVYRKDSPVVAPPRFRGHVLGQLDWIAWMPRLAAEGAVAGLLAVLACTLSGSGRPSAETLGRSDGGHS